MSDARVRLMGGGVLFRFGMDVKGRLLSELFAAGDVKQHLAMTRRACADNAPVLAQSSLQMGGLHVMSLEIIVIPLQSPDRAVPMVMVSVQPCSPPG